MSARDPAVAGTMPADPDTLIADVVRLGILPATPNRHLPGRRAAG